MSDPDLLARRRDLLRELVRLNATLGAMGYPPARLLGGRAHTPRTRLALDAVRAGATTARGVAQRTGMVQPHAAVALAQLARAGDVVRVRWGVYALPMAAGSEAA